MQKIKIDKNIPIPFHKGMKGYYPFIKMKVGDSFFIKDKKINLTTLAIQATSKYKTQRKFVTRTLKDGKRIWRVK